MKTFILSQWEKGMECDTPFNRHTLGLALAGGMLGSTLGFFIGLLFFPL